MKGVPFPLHFTAYPRIHAQKILKLVDDKRYWAIARIGKYPTENLGKARLLSRNEFPEFP